MGGLFGLVKTSEANKPLERALGLGSLVSKPTFGAGLTGPFGIGGAISDLFPPPSPSPNPFAKASAVSDLFGSLAPGIAPAITPKRAIKRKAFFSFHYDDIMRVNVVRNAWRIDHPDNVLMRSFQDSSLWESRKLEGDEAIKRLIREGVDYTSAVCVLIGTGTWVRRWVRYEIARAVVDGRGLLSVHLNSIRHHSTKTPHTRGHNPLDFLAVGKVQEHPLKPPRHFLFERLAIPNGFGGHEWQWHRYSDYTLAVPLPRWLEDPADGYVTPLSRCTSTYDYIADKGHQNIGSWIDAAAQAAGR